MASVRSQWWCCACAVVVPGGGVTQLYQAVRVSATTNRCCKVAPGWLTSHVPVTVGCSTCLRVVARQGCYARICATHQISRGAGEKRYSGRRARTVHCCKLGSSVHEHADHNGPAVAAESESFRCLRVLARRGRRRRRGRDRARGPAADGAARGLGAAPRARKTQQDASLAARIARDDRKRGGGRGGGRGRIRGDDSDDDAAGSASDDPTTRASRATGEVARPRRRTAVRGAARAARRRTRGGGAAARGRGATRSVEAAEEKQWGGCSDPLLQVDYLTIWSVRGWPEVASHSG